ncbi:SPOSA6832_03922 [Sporobolomyces salmonicolor]|uniref:SPOSA6832_03922-mRNA-1:cds n=1 Tax=Sporidiobolus salmonicolor TaxID=5005 RepID=A0A0D6EQN0_SPOSA|nr:SPOSA6832_03922 [Sporobolomyces salmonicolor]
MSLPSSASPAGAPPSLPPPSSPPPSHLTINRRRSISRSSQGSSFRSSLGGKPIVGPRYAGMRRAKSPTGQGSLPQPHPDTAGESALSESDAGSEAGTRAFGSFSHTREELRDGSARLAAFSLHAPFPVPVPAEPTLPATSPIAEQPSSPFPPPAPPSPPAAPLSAGATSGLKALPPSSDPASTSLSGLSRNRPSHLVEGPADLSSSASHDPTPGSSPDSAASERTPTQSNVGSLTTKVSADALGEGEGGRTPTPARMLRTARERKERERSASPSERRDGQEPQILGDDPGGADSEEDEETMLEAQLEDEADESVIGALRLKGNGNGNGHVDESNERTPLLGQLGKHHRTGNEGVAGLAAKAKRKVVSWADDVAQKAKKTRKEDIVDLGRDVVGAIPAVILGCVFSLSLTHLRNLTLTYRRKSTLMNVLDGVSYGMIMFPTNLPVFADFGGIGVSMFFVSCLVSQLCFTGGGSIFKGGNGSMMIEVVPFYHAIVGILSAHISDDHSLVSTTMVAFALSSILTGLAFGALGFMKLGRLSEFFPRHILVGTIGGVGAFLFVTGLQVSARMEEDAGISLELIQHFFDTEILPLILAVVLRLITARWKHPLIFPAYFLAIPLAFYALTSAVGLSVEELREMGYVFEVSGVNSKWYEYWTLYDFKKTDWGALLETVPTQLALVFFGLLHVPINVPALAISVGEDNVDTDRELVAHGISNVASGLLGSVPNYLCYVGGSTRISGFLLALGSLGVLVAGPGVIGFLPVCVVAALIFILGIDLVKEALVDTYGRVSHFEYASIWAVVFIMTIWDFVIGLAAGLVLASVSFVIMSSQRRAIRSILSGSVAHSTVRRHPKQSAFLKEVGRQIRVIKLQGFLFFGTISSCEATVRKILEAASWSSNPIRFLVLDFSMASGVDFSAAEAFVRMQRLLDERGVQLVLCGCPVDSSVGVALRSVDLWTDGSDEKVVVLENLNDALEHCENAFLRSLYSKTFRPAQLGLSTSSSAAISSQIGTSRTARPPSSSLLITSYTDMPNSDFDSDIESFAGSPRASHLRNAAKQTISRPETPQPMMNFQQPLPILLQSLRPYSPDLNEDYCFRLVPYFKRVHVERGTTLWTNGSEPDAYVRPLILPRRRIDFHLIYSFYVIESGMLRATYVFAERAHSISESMVAGTVAGELSFLSRTKRNTNVVAERDSVLWKMEVGSHEDLGKKEGWQFARRFEEVLLKIAAAETEGPSHEFALT